MRVLVLLGILCLAGCSSFASMEQLEHEAAISGDWSAVEKRELIIAKRKARKGPTCGGDLIAFCENRMGSQRCACVDRERVSDFFAGTR